MTIFGLKLPQDRPVDNLAVLALLSVPVALVAVTGYGLYRGAVAVRRRLHNEASEELCERMERVARLGSALEIEG